MTKLEIRSERQSLGHGDITPGFEHHHGNWASRKTITDNQLSNNIETNLLIGDSLNHSDGNDVEESDDKCKDEPLYGELSFPTLDDSNTKGEHSH